jgi:hypothetical protein
VFAVLGSLLLFGCATPSSLRADADERAQCIEVFRRVDAAVARAGVADGMAARAAGFPYLRVNRFLASYAGEEMTDAQFTEWMGRLVALGTDGYAVELGNLSVEDAERLAHDLWSIGERYAWVRPAVAECTARLAELDAVDAKRRAELRRAARVPDDYATWQRIVGLYWMTRVPFAAGVRRWHAETGAVFAQPLPALPVRGRLHAYVPPAGPSTPGQTTGIVVRSSANALAIPEPRGADLEALFRVHAPVFEVDVAGDADQPGEPGWDENGTPRIVSKRPVVYRRASHTRYQGRALLQLNYAIWFPERPKESGWDLLGGRLDGVLWRVTLGPDGTPWVYDSMHLCGCYHLFFPTARAAAKPQPDTLDEPAFAPQTLPRVAPGERIVVRLASRTHHVERVALARGPTGGFEYVFVEDDTLRARPLPRGGTRSIFRPDGIVPGSERAERYFFWPMGIAEPGAMRQWGRHATAFVGRRHFDDADLLERYFDFKGVIGE